MKGPGVRPQAAVGRLPWRKILDLPYLYIGADDRAGPTNTGQPVEGGSVGWAPPTVRNPLGRGSFLLVGGAHPTEDRTALTTSCPS